MKMKFNIDCFFKSLKKKCTILTLLIKQYIGNKQLIVSIVGVDGKDYNDDIAKNARHLT